MKREDIAIGQTVYWPGIAFHMGRFRPVVRSGEVEREIRPCQFKVRLDDGRAFQKHAKNVSATSGEAFYRMGKLSEKR